MDSALPTELAVAVRRVRAVEGTAQRRAQARAAVDATNQLLRAIVDAGWQVKHVAEPAGLSASAVSKRVLAARSDHPGPVRGLAIVAPPQPAAVLREFLRLPAGQRHWLTIGEALALTGRSRAGFRNWRRAGFLPNTLKNHSLGLYYRGDLQRLLDAPARTNGIDHEAVYEQIAISRAAGQAWARWLRQQQPGSPA